jgi:mannose-6-phosphate isomerase-like protein (cupin superfamily)
MTDGVRPFAIQNGEGTALTTPTGDTITVKAGTQATNGSLSIFDLVVAPGSGPALHIHTRDDEVWYVLDGEFRFKSGGVMLSASTGGMAFGPRGMPHCFQNIGDTAGRLLVITTPSGSERFFEQVAELLPGPVDAQTLAAVGHANWIKFIGPPLAVSDPL